MLTHRRIDDLPPQVAQPAQRGRFVRCHPAREADHIGSENGGQAAVRSRHAPGLGGAGAPRQGCPGMLARTPAPRPDRGRLPAGGLGRAT
jgi:hypothetical protein